MRKYREDDEELSVLSDLLRYADHNNKFNRSYVDSIYDFLEKHEYITINQLDILKNIFSENNVEDFIKEKYYT